MKSREHLQTEILWKRLEANVPHLKKLEGERCYLSPCSTSDAEDWARWDSDLEVCLPLGEEAYTLYSVEKEQEILKTLIEKQAPVFNVVLQAGDKLVGRCMLFQVDQVNRNAMFGMVIGEKAHWGQGIGLEATKLILDYGFNLLNLNNIMLGVYSFNKRAVRCYEKAGFKEIGRRRETRIVAGKAFDVILMDILAIEFESDLVGRMINQ